jgi:flagellar hook-associated protein 3 FlgL
MRITNSLITARSQLRLQQGLQGVDRLRDDISTGVRIRKMSDDSARGSEIVRIGSSMRAITQFRRNSAAGIARAVAEENVLDRLGNNLTRALELAVGQSSATANAQTRTIAKAEVDQLLRFSVDLGNSRVGDEYLFGGTRAGEAPFAVPVPATGSFSALTITTGAPPVTTTVDPSGNPTIEIADKRFISPNHNGTEVFLDTGALTALRDLSTALGANDVAGISNAITALTGANDKVQSLVGTQGARINEMESAKLALDQMEIDLKTFRSDLRDTEIDKAMAELVGKQTLYQAAMGATSRILGLSLANYL